MKQLGKSVAVAAALALGAALLSGCGGDIGPDVAALATAPLPKAQARLKIHRESAFTGSAVDIAIKIDGREVAGIGNGQMRVFDVPAGSHLIAVEHWSHPGTSKLTLQTKPGMVYEIELAARAEAAVAGMMFGIVGTAVESAANGDAGYWGITVVGQHPAG
jgi:hypothetical protein